MSSFFFKAPTDLSFISSVNPPDVLYAAMPAYIYLWPDLLGLLLGPLLDYQETPAYANPYAAQDIGLFASEAAISRNSCISQEALIQTPRVTHRPIICRLSSRRT